MNNLTINVCEQTDYTRLDLDTMEPSKFKKKFLDTIRGITRFYTSDYTFKLDNRYYFDNSTNNLKDFTPSNLDDLYQVHLSNSSENYTFRVELSNEKCHGLPLSPYDMLNVRMKQVSREKIRPTIYGDRFGYKFKDDSGMLDQSSMLPNVIHFNKAELTSREAINIKYPDRIEFEWLSPDGSHYCNPDNQRRYKEGEIIHPTYMCIERGKVISYSKTVNKEKSDVKSDVKSCFKHCLHEHAERLSGRFCHNYWIDDIRVEPCIWKRKKEEFNKSKEQETTFITQIDALNKQLEDLKLNTIDKKRVN